MMFSERPVIFSFLFCLFYTSAAFSQQSPEVEQQRVETRFHNLEQRVAELRERTDRRLDDILRELDKLDNELDSNSKQISLVLSRVNEFEQKWVEIQSTLAEAKRSEQEIRQLLTSLDDYYETTGDNNKQVTNAIANLANLTKNVEKTEDELHKNIARLENDVDSFGNIIKWVTAIVSILVIIIGLFFSTRFLDLYSSIRFLEKEREEARAAEKNAHPDIART